jgi:alpha-beta hydrolase superfamily lysophospholipase
VAQHHIIYIPGLFDKLNRRIGQATALALWRLNGIHPHYFVVGWANEQESFDAKLDRLLKRIDDLKAHGHHVSLVAASAGASLALVALHERPNELRAVVTICAMLRRPPNFDELIFATNPAVEGSLEHFALIESQIPPEVRKKILSAQPRDDKVIPVGEMHIPGAQVEQLPIRGHVAGIFTALTIFRRRLIAFIRRGGV